MSRCRHCKRSGRTALIAPAGSRTRSHIALRSNAPLGPSAWGPILGASPPARFVGKPPGGRWGGSTRGGGKGTVLKRPPVRPSAVLHRRWRRDRTRPLPGLPPGSIGTQSRNCTGRRGRAAPKTMEQSPTTTRRPLLSTEPQWGERLDAGRMRSARGAAARVTTGANMASFGRGLW